MSFGAFVQGATKDAGSSSSATLAFGSNVTAGNTLLMCLRQGGTGGNTITVSDNLNGNWTQDLAQQVTSAGNQSTWRFSNTAGGACTVTVSFNSAASMRFAITEYSGAFTLDTNGGTAQNQGNSANSTLTSGSLTTSQTCAIIGTVIGGLNETGTTNNSVTAGSGFTLEENLVKSNGAGGQETAAAIEDMGTTQAAGSYTATFTWSNNADNWGCQILAFYNASAAPAYYPFKRINTAPIRRAANW